jgi:6-pyruvoyltetrahydropterin/6-carboxytetrahydropterin synthase
MKVCRRVNFNAAHRLYRPDWSDEQNNEVYGKCNNPNFHGHNYVMEVWVEGEVDSETGYVIDLKILKQIINEHIVNEFDHKNLNLDCKEFESLIPTAENIIAVSWKKLRKALDPKYGIKLKLWETENNIFEYDGD